MKNIMTLDLGRFTGFCLGDTEDGISDYFTYDLQKGCKYNPGYMWKGHKEFNKTRQEKMNAFKWTLDWWIDKHKPKVIIYERPFVRGDAATRTLWGFAGIVESFGIETYDVAVSSIKKHATGKGTAEKEDMVKAAERIIKEQMFTYNLKRDEDYDLTDHEADAICLFDYFIKNRDSLENPPRMKPKPKRKKKNDKTKKKD